MLRPSDEERLSAYFDEELSAAERAEAESLLREEPAARQWLEALEDLHGGLRSLPRLRLPGDFADDVLRRAEREMLLEGGSVGAQGVATHAQQPDLTHGQTGVASRNGSVSSGSVSSGSVSSGSVSGPVGSIYTSGIRLDARLQGARLPAASPAPAAVRWHAPSWLAAAASLLLFAGVLGLASSERNWASPPSPSTSTALGRGLQQDGESARMPLPTDSGEKLASTSAASAAEGRADVVGATEYLAREKGLESQASQVVGKPEAASRGKATRSVASETDVTDGDPDRQWHKKFTGGETKDPPGRRAEGAGAAPIGTPQAPLGDALAGGGGGGLAGAGEPSGPPPGKSPPGKSPPSGEPGSGLGVGETLDSFYQRAAPGGRSNGVPATANLANWDYATKVGNSTNVTATNVIVLDVDGAPAEAFARIEAALLLKRKFVGASAAGDSLRMAQAAKDVTLSAVLDKTEPAREPRSADDQSNGKSKGLSDPVAAGSTLWTCRRRSWRGTLRDVAGVAAGNADIAVTNVATFSAPLKEGETTHEQVEASRLYDGRLQQGPGGAPGAPPHRADADKHDVVPLADPRTSGQNNAVTKRAAGADPPKKASPEPGETRGGGLPRGRAIPEDEADKKSLLKSLEKAEKLTEREEKREKDGVTWRETTRTPPGESAKRPPPADRFDAVPDGNTAPSPAKPVAPKRAARFADNSAPQPKTLAAGMAAAPPTSGASSLPTIIVIRVNPPTRPAAAAPAPSSK